MHQFSILSWNVHGRPNKRNGHNRGLSTSFKRILPKLAASSADIICLQEMPDAITKLGKLEEFKNYNFFVPKLNGSKQENIHGFNHNILLSKYPIISAEEITFSNFSKKPLPFENAVKAHIQIESKIVRIYICHFAINEVGMATRLKQLDFIMADSQDWQGPVIVCGDMNICMPKAGMARKIVKWWHRWPQEEMHLNNKLVEVAEKDIFHSSIQKYGFRETLDINQPTWSPFRTGLWELFQLKLDWFLVKNLRPVEATVGNYISDHRPISVKCEIN